MTFDEHTDSWFDDLIAFVREHGLRRSLTLIDRLRRQSRTLPSQKNAITLRQAIGRFGHPALLAHADAVLRGQFKREFRRGFSHCKRHVSAASALFSLVYQAVTYSQ